jgi:GH35 family endo-1,4-beta-xylanase
MPTTRPRYTVTDTGEMREMLDLAHRRWPEIEDRRQLLLRLAGAGAETVASELDVVVADSRREDQRQALARAAELIDAEMLLTDSAWR